LREKIGNPELMANIETLITSSKKGRDRLKQFEARLAVRRKLMATVSAKAS